MIPFQSTFSQDLVDQSLKLTIRAIFVRHSVLPPFLFGTQTLMWSYYSD